jgi:hypothetical protein
MANLRGMKRGWNYDAVSNSLDLMVNGRIVEKFAGSPVAGEYPNIYATGTTKLFPVGTRLELPDGRVFRYALSSGACYAGQGASFINDKAVGWTTIATTAAIGATSVDITAATHDELTADQLEGGYIIIYGAGNNDVQFRGILRNDASAASAAISNVKIDGPLVAAVTGASTGCELFYNPYASIALDAVVYTSIAGIPACEISATGYYFWLQTWGPCWCAPQTAGFADNNDRGFYWRHDGSIEAEIANASKGGYNSTQYGGFLITAGFTAGPLIMLEISP